MLANMKRSSLNYFFFLILVPHLTPLGALLTKPVLTSYTNGMVKIPKHIPRLCICDSTTYKGMFSCFNNDPNKYKSQICWPNVIKMNNIQHFLVTEVRCASMCEILIKCLVKFVIFDIFCIRPHYFIGAYILYF